MQERQADIIEIASLDTFVLGARVSQGPLSSLGVMPVRRACLLRVRDADGAHGWGEIWCNFPPRGAESRAHLVADVIAPVLLGMRFSSWLEVRPSLEAALGRMAIHTGEAGAFAQCIAGIDLAVADLAARRAMMSMTTFLGGGATTAQVYASTPSGGDLRERCAGILDLGHRAIKLKIGYDADADQSAVAACREIVGPQFGLMVDANQAWDCEQAIARINSLARYEIDFVEEPLRADAPLDQWCRLAQAVRVPIAAGENIVGENAFAEVMTARALRVVQPDVAKWGGVSGALAVGRRANVLGLRCCMHFMGSGLGLAASLHVLAAIGGDGAVELDVNENPLRTELGPLDLAVRDGALPVPVGCGFGFDPDAAALRRLSLH
ncbi:MAG: mandelate racemase/muconate lactonizing enzyme family protein [Betaproteobacteria bacterium]